MLHLATPSRVTPPALQRVITNSHPASYKACAASVVPSRAEEWLVVSGAVNGRDALLRVRRCTSGKLLLLIAPRNSLS
jgi:hypothetical protein